MQIDGSPHDWFEAHAIPLIVFIDDAPGELMALRFAPADPGLPGMRFPVPVACRVLCRWAYEGASAMIC